MAQIWTYTHDRWGRAQADLYSDKLRAIAHSLLDRSEAGRAVEFSGTVRRIRAAHHFLYFRVSDEEILILRILHERMDQGGHLHDLA